MTIVFENFKEFIREYSARISMSGMFIRLEKPYPPGTTLALDLKLGQDFPLIQGTGEVVWTRERDESPDRPAGVGIRFRDISEQSRDLTYAIVERRMADGGELFRLEGPQQIESQNLPDLQELLQSAGKRRLREEARELEPLDAPAADALGARAASSQSASAQDAGALRLDDDLLEAELPDLDGPSGRAPAADELSLDDLDGDDFTVGEASSASLSVDDPLDDLEQLSLLDDPPAATKSPRFDPDDDAESAELVGFELDDEPDVPAGAAAPASPRDALTMDDDDLDIEFAVTPPKPPEPSGEHPLLQPSMLDDGGLSDDADSVLDAPAQAWHGRRESEEEELDDAPALPTSLGAAGTGDDLDAFEPVEAGRDWPRPGQPLGDGGPPPPRSVTESFPMVDDDEGGGKPGVDLDELFRVAPSAGGTSLPSRHTSAVAVSSDDHSERNFKPLLLALLVLVVLAAGYYYMAVVGMVPDFGLLGGDSQQARTETPPPGEPAGDPSTGDPSAGDPSTTDPATTDPATADPVSGGEPSTVGEPGSSPRATPPPPAAPPVSTPPVSPPTSPPVTTTAARDARVLEIEVDTDGRQTRIVVTTDVPLSQAQIARTRLENPARELVRLVGIGEPFGRTSIEAGTPQVQRVRTGYHEKASGNELHLVIDLASPSVQLDRIEPSGRRVVIWIRG